MKKEIRHQVSDVGKEETVTSDSAGVVLTRLEWSIIADWLEHGRQFERDSQGDEPQFRWPELTGQVLDKINAALARGGDVLIRPSVVLPVIPNPWRVP